MGAFAFVDFCLLAAGAILIAFSEIWRQPNLMFNFTLGSAGSCPRSIRYVQLHIF